MAYLPEKMSGLDDDGASLLEICEDESICSCRIAYDLWWGRIQVLVGIEWQRRQKSSKLDTAFCGAG